MALDEEDDEVDAEADDESLTLLSALAPDAAELPLLLLLLASRDD